MSDILVQFDNRTNTVKSVMVARRCLSSEDNEEILDLDEHDMGPEDNPAPRPPGRCQKWRICTLISIATIAALVGFICGVFASERSPVAGISQNVLASSQTGNMEINSGGLDLRNNVNESVCEGPACLVCRAQVPSPVNVQGDAFQSSHTDPNVENSSCYRCNGECEPLDFLLNAFHSGDSGGYLLCGGPPREIKCYTITQMGNLGNVCGVDGQYNCYRDENNKLQPVCKCPPGKTGDRCQESSMDELKCNCYYPAYKFCGQEDMIECNSKDRDRNVTQCFMDADRNGQHFNCLCNKIGDDDSDVKDLDSCSIPHTDRNTQDENTQANDSAKLFQGFIMCIVSLAISLVDKT